MAEEKSVAEELGVRLRCGVYGEATVFSVKIALDADVEALQTAIFDDQRYHERFLFPASSLTLYLAWKEGDTKWLKDDDNLDILLRGGVSTEYEEMLSSWRLNKKELFGPSFTPGDEDIHVLVELPEAVVPAPTIASRRQALQQNVVLYGVRGTIGRLQGIDPNDSRTLSRMTLTNDIIRRVDEMHVCS